jgi:hypothetical protein
MRRVMMMMRPLLALPLFAAACTTASPSGGESYDSVRERLASGPTRMFMAGAESTGVVTARRWTSGGWIEGDTPLVIDSGELSATVDASGTLTMKSFEVGIAPIEIPEDVFKKPAQLTDVRIKLTAPASGAATWATDDAASATLSMTLDLEWAILVNGGKTPLGAHHLPQINVDFTLGGDGDHIEASAGLAANGELWNWAGLLEFSHLELGLAASTTD